MLGWLHQGDDSGRGSHPPQGAPGRDNTIPGGASRCELGDAFIYAANLNSTDLRKTDLSGANLYGTLFMWANLSGADLRGAKFYQTQLSEADFTGTLAGETIFADVDLSLAIGLETIHHEGPSIVGIDTIYKSHGRIPEIFLRGCGVPENFVEYMHPLTRKAFEFYSCFISYSSKDQEFADRLYADLQAKACAAGLCRRT